MSDGKEVNLPDEKIETINDGSGTHIDPEAEKRLLRKLDMRVLPPLFILFLLAFLDRTNIGKGSFETYEASVDLVREREDPRTH